MVREAGPFFFSDNLSGQLDRTACPAYLPGMEKRMTGQQALAQRRVLRLSQEKLAQLMGVSSRTIRRYERRGKEPLLPIPARAVASAFAEALRAQNRRGK